MSIDRLIEGWKEVRKGLIEEASQIPDDQFSFRATPDTRSVAELLQHVVESQKMLVGESCRPDTNLMRQSFADHIKEYAAEVTTVQDKNGLLELMRSSMETSEACIRAGGEKLQEMMRRFDGKEMSKLDFLTFAVAHEMYHRGQLTVYLRLLGIEPALTRRFKKIFAKAE
ncbi:MAG: DinB family protein [Acidobacteriota bacterium]|nr:DinB family protein [Acidobacteriota bacterium]